MNKLAGKMCFQMQYLRGGSLKFTAFQCCHPQSPRADVTFIIVKLPCLSDCGPVSNTLLKVCGEVFISFRPGVYIQTFSAYIIIVIDMNY